MRGVGVVLHVREGVKEGEMAICEKCWEMSGGDADRYVKLVKSEKCSPEEQAGQYAYKCPACGRMTMHSYANICMNPTCPCKPWPKQEVTS